MLKCIMAMHNQFLTLFTMHCNATGFSVFKCCKYRVALLAPTMSVNAQCVHSGDVRDD